MAGFGQNDEVVVPKTKPFGANDEVVSDGNHEAGSPKQSPATPKHGFFDPVDPKLIDTGAPDALLPRADNPYGKAVVDNMTGGFSDIGNGEYSRGAHKLITGAGIAAAPLALPFAVAAPAAAVGAGLVGYGTGKVARGVADIAGATQDQKDLAEDFGNFAGGPVGGATFESPAVRGFTKGALSVVPKKLPAMAVGGGLLGAHLPPWLTAAGEAAYALPDMIRSGIAGAKGRLPFGPVTESLMPHTPLPQRPAFEDRNFTPPVFDQSPPVGQPGAVLPSGSVVGPAPPSRVHPPLPRGNAPRVPGWQRMPISGERPLPTQDFAPTYPATPMLESGHVIGPRPSFTGEPSSPGVVVNGPVRVSGPATGTTQIANPSQLTTMQSPPLASSKESVVFSNSSPHAGPYGMRATLGTSAEMMRQNRLARGLDVPPAEPLPVNAPDTPSGYRERLNQSRSKFDANGKNKKTK